MPKTSIQLLHAILTEKLITPNIPTRRKHDTLSNNSEFELVQQDWKNWMANWEKSEYAKRLDRHVFSFTKTHLRTETGGMIRIGPLHHMTYSPTVRMPVNVTPEKFAQNYDRHYPPLKIQLGYEQFRDDPTNSSDRWRKCHKAVQRMLKKAEPVTLADTKWKKKNVKDKDKRLANTVCGPYLCSVFDTMENCNVRLPKDPAKRKTQDDEDGAQNETNNNQKVLTPMAFNYIYFATFMRHRLKAKNDEHLVKDLEFLVRYKSDNYFDIKLGIQAGTNYNMKSGKWDDNRTLGLTHVLATCAVTATCCRESFNLMNTMLSSFIYDEKMYTVDCNQLKLKVGKYTTY